MACNNAAATAQWPCTARETATFATWTVAYACTEVVVLHPRGVSFDSQVNSGENTQHSSARLEFKGVCSVVATIHVDSPPRWCGPLLTDLFCWFGTLGRARRRICQLASRHCSKSQPRGLSTLTRQTRPRLQSQLQRLLELSVTVRSDNDTHTHTEHPHHATQPTRSTPHHVGAATYTPSV